MKHKESHSLNIYKRKEVGSSVRSTQNINESNIQLDYSIEIGFVE